MFSGSITGAEQRAAVTAVVHVQHSVYTLFSGIPAVDKNPVSAAFHKWCPVCAGKCITVSSKGIGCFCQVSEIIPELFSPAPWSEHIQLGPIAVEEGDGYFAVEYILSDVSHPEDGKIGPD